MGPCFRRDDINKVLHYNRRGMNNSMQRCFASLVQSAAVGSLLWAALPPAATPDLRVLDTLADELGIDLGFPTVAAALAELNAMGTWDGTPGPAPTVAAAAAPTPGAGEAVLAGWRMLLDDGRLQDGEPYLAGTARTPVVRLSAETAGAIGAADGDNVTVSTARGAITLPLTITDMPDHVAWLPLNSPGSAVHRQLGVTPGAVVKIRAAQMIGVQK